MEINSEQSVSVTMATFKLNKHETVSSETPVKNDKNTPDASKAELNRSILEASLEVNLKAGNDPLALLYRAAIEGINDVLKSEFGDNAIQKIQASGVDTSPEATADRIVKFSTAFFSKYQENHPEMSTEDALNSFVKVIGGGIDRGFNEAKNILKGLNVLEGSIASNVDSTYEKVQQGLKAFVDNYPRPEAAQTSTPTKPAPEVSV